MRKNIFVALVAVCLAVPGMATVSSSSMVDPIPIGSDQVSVLKSSKLGGSINID
jgi:hypothetical protein